MQLLSYLRCEACVHIKCLLHSHCSHAAAAMDLMHDQLIECYHYEILTVCL